MTGRASYQHIPNIVLGKSKKSPSRQTALKKKTKPVKGATFSPQSTPYSSPVTVSPKPVRPKLTLKF